MITMILLSHIAIASLLTIATIKVAFSGYFRKGTSVYNVMLASFVATSLSGIGLLLVGAGGLGRVCATMTAVTMVVFVVRAYYRIRVISETV